MSSQIQSSGISPFDLRYQVIKEESESVFLHDFFERISSVERLPEGIMEQIGRSATIKGRLVYHRVLDGSKSSEVLCGAVITEEMRQRFTILFLRTTSDYSGKGVSSLMLSQMTGVAKRLNYRDIHASINPLDLASFPFFERKGFQRLSGSPSVAERVMMVKSLIDQESFPQKRSRDAISSSSPPRKVQATDLTRSEGPSKTCIVDPDQQAPQASHLRFDDEGVAMRPQKFVIVDRSRGNLGNVLKLPLKRQYLELIKSGAKTVEGRIANAMFLNLFPGKRIQFFCGGAQVLCRVTRVTKYKSFAEMLQNEGVEQCLPGTRSLADGIRIYDRIPGYQEKAQLRGVVAIAISVEGE